MNSIKKVLIGSLVGIGSILPGVSGGMIAAAFNIYRELIDALHIFFKKPLKAIKSIWQYLIGIFMGVLLGFLVIKFIFDHIPIPSTLLFIGLIIGSFPDIWFLAKQKGYDLKGFLVSSLMFVIMIGILFLPSSNETSNHWYLWVIVGALIATSLIVPGLSGTMVLLMIGYYQPLLTFVDEGLQAFKNFDFTTIWQMIPTALWIILGALLAVFILVRLMVWILKKAPERFYQAIIGIIVASPINIMGSLYLDLKEEINIFDFTQHWYMWLIGICLVPVGIILARLFSKDEHETEEN